MGSGLWRQHRPRDAPRGSPGEHASPWGGTSAAAGGFVLGAEAPSTDLLVPPQPQRARSHPVPICPPKPAVMGRLHSLHSAVPPAPGVTTSRTLPAPGQGQVTRPRMVPSGAFAGDPGLPDGQGPNSCSVAIPTPPPPQQNRNHPANAAAATLLLFSQLKQRGFSPGVDSAFLTLYLFWLHWHLCSKHLQTQ